VFLEELKASLVDVPPSPLGEVPTGEEGAEGESGGYGATKLNARLARAQSRMAASLQSYVSSNSIQNFTKRNLIACAQGGRCTYR